MDNDLKSSCKAQSNRKNAQRSTGPRTERAKRITRWNAVKHGLLSKAVVITTGERKENAEEYQSVLAQLRKDLRPVGTLEEMLVEQICTSYWRLKRVLLCEAGEIVAAQTSPYNGEGGPGLAALEMVEECRTIDSSAVEERIKLLETLTQILEKDEALSEERLSQLNEKFGAKSPFARHLSLLNNGLMDSREGPERERFEDIRGEMVEYLRHEREVLESVAKQLKKKEEIESDARMASLNLPSGKITEKITRYETTIQRRMHKAIETLERLQRMRKKQLGPTPETEIGLKN